MKRSSVKCGTCTRLEADSCFFLGVPFVLGVSARGSVLLGSCHHCLSVKEECTFVLKESDSHGLRGPPMASTLISYTESYDVDVEHAKMFSYKPSSRNLHDNPVLPVSP
jgi:hypothetical protein